MAGSGLFLVETIRWIVFWWTWVLAGEDVAPPRLYDFGGGGRTQSLNRDLGERL